MKKTWDIVKKILVILIVLFALFMMVFTIVSAATFDRIDRSLFGYRAFIVLSDSMSATDFDAGDLILVKEVDPATLEVGDIVSYQSNNEMNYGDVVTHKIRAVTVNENGEPGFITYGTTTGTDDEGIVTYSQVLGEYRFRIAGAGTFFSFLKTTPGYILCILLPFLILIAMQIINSMRLFRQYKKEQMAEINAQRAESEKMMEEIIRLRQELMGDTSGQDIRPEESPESSDKNGSDSRRADE